MVQGVEAFQEFCKGGWAGARSLGQSQHGPRCRSVHLFSPCYHFDFKAASEYPFARYNVKFPDCTYSQEEYTQLLEGSRLNHPSVAHTHSHHWQTQNGPRKRRTIFSISFANMTADSTLSPTAMSTLADHLVRWR